MKQQQQQQHQRESSIATPIQNVQLPQNGQLKLPTWGVITVLVVVMIILKMFIYIKDGKRHGK